MMQYKAGQTGWSCLQKNPVLFKSTRRCNEMQSRGKQLCCLGCTPLQFLSAWVCHDHTRHMRLATGSETTTNVCASESRSTPGYMAWVRREGGKCPGNPAFAPYPHFVCGMSRKTTYVCQESVSTKAQNETSGHQSVSTRRLTEGKHRLNIRRNFLRLRCIKLWNHLPRGAVGTMKPATYSTVKHLVDANPILVQGSCTDSSTMSFPTLAPKNQTQEVQGKKDKQ